MKKWILVPFWLAVLAFVFGVSTRIASPAAKTRFYVGLHREWTAHWPWEQGKQFPVFLARWFTPMAPAWVQVEPHVTMLLDPDDLVSKVILITGSWEPESWHAIDRHLAPGATFVDVGAHIGYYSLKAAPVVGAAGRVIAIEPNPQTIVKLRDNIRASAAGVIAVQPVACSNSEATLELFAAPSSNTGETSLSRTNAGQEGPVQTSYRVRARPLDAIVREAGLSRVDAVKIDVEGAEFLVPQGAQETLDRYRPMVLVELIDRQLQAMGSSSAEVLAFMSRRGYSLRRAYGFNFEFDPAKP